MNPGTRLVLFSSRQASDLRNLHYRNFRPSNTLHLMAGLARVRDGTGRLIIACGPGDSTTAGTGAATGTSGQVGAYPLSWPAQFQSLLAARFTTTGSNSLFGQINRGVVTYASFDTRATFGSGWAASTFTSIGPMWANSTTTNALSFVPADSFDSIDVFYTSNTAPAQATFTVNVDGGAALATVDANVTAALRKLTITGIALATHTINIQRTGAGGILNIAGIVAYNSTAPGINIWNWGDHGTKAATWSASTGVWSLVNSLGTYAPDVMIYGLGINDEDVTDHATFKTQVQTIVTKQLLTGDCIIAIPNPVNPAANTQAGQNDIRAALLEIATTNNLPVIDRTLEMVSYASANANSWMYDNLHPNQAGYAVVAALVNKAILSAVA